MDGPPFAADSHQTAVWHFDAARGPSTPSLDHLVGGNQQTTRHGEAERLCGLEVEDRLELARCLHRQVGGLVAAQDAIDICRVLPKLDGPGKPVGHDTTGGHKDTKVVDRWQPMSSR